MKITAHDVALELRTLADALDTNPELEVPHAFVCFSCSTKESLMGIAKLMPRPFTKNVIENSMLLWLQAPQSLTCTLVTPARPAVYDCDPLLSPDEENALEVQP